MLYVLYIILLVFICSGLFSFSVGGAIFISVPSFLSIFRNCLWLFWSTFVSFISTTFAKFHFLRRHHRQYVYSYRHICSLGKYNFICFLFLCCNFWRKRWKFLLSTCYKHRHIHYRIQTIKSKIPNTNKQFIFFAWGMGELHLHRPGSKPYSSTIIHQQGGSWKQDAPTKQ